MAALFLVDPAVDVHQELKTELGKFLAVKAQHRALPSAGRDKDFVVLLRQLADLEILAQFRIRHELDAHVFQRLDDRADIFLRQTEVRNRVHQTAARFFHRVIDRHGVTGAAQIIRRRQTRGARADERDLLARFLFRSLVEGIQMCHDVIADHALNAVDRDRLIRGAAVALRLAGMRADAAGHHRQRVRLHQDAGSALHIPGAVMRHVIRDIRTRRAFGRAGRGACLHAAEH